MSHRLMRIEIKLSDVQKSKRTYNKIYLKPLSTARKSVSQRIFLWHSNCEGHGMLYYLKNDLRCASSPQGRPFFASFFWARECVKTPNTIADWADYLLDINDQDKVVVNPQVSALMSRGPLNVFETRSKKHRT